MFHATTITGMMGEVNNNSFDCSSLGFVDSHGNSKIKGKWLLCMDFSNGREHVLGAEGAAFAGAFPRRFSHCGGKGNDNGSVLGVNVVAVMILPMQLMLLSPRPKGGRMMMSLSLERLLPSSRRS